MLTLRGRSRGFTLIELMLVVAIIGLLAAIAIPKFGDAIIRSKEAAVRGHMGALRSAISIYYADNEGFFPKVMGLQGIMPGLNVGNKYLTAIPPIKIPTAPIHQNSDLICSTFFGEWACAGGVLGETVWLFNPSMGVLVVNCGHPDSRGVIWSIQ
ncbi:MAG: prepilin-type N-terminal cleavage/methylation domain-containing protein [Elusimicrobia bacterium]|nr:prepilin-type N-terminal cleavage/methylation domain-containing protein [Elusimicrobiota bacterium]